MNKKIFYLIIIILVFSLVNNFTPPFNGFMVDFFNNFIFAKSINSKSPGVKQGGGKKKRQPVTFAISVEITSVDVENNKIKGTGLSGSSTGQEFLYEEIDYDLSSAVIEDGLGAEKSIEDLIGVRLVYVHGTNNNDGTLTVNKIVIQN